MGIVAETLRRHPRARRSLHPIQSFAGIYADKFLAAQTLQNPLGPIGALAEADGWVLLLGVDHTVDTSIHYAEKLAGRKQFTRWALLSDRIIECPGFPGDSAGFDAIAPDLVASHADHQGRRWHDPGDLTSHLDPRGNPADPGRSAGALVRAPGLPALQCGKGIGAGRITGYVREIEKLPASPLPVFAPRAGQRACHKPEEVRFEVSEFGEIRSRGDGAWHPLRRCPDTPPRGHRHQR